MSLMNPQPPLEGSEPQVMVLDDDDSPMENKWVRIARQIYEDSTEYLDANIRYHWEIIFLFLTAIIPQAPSIIQHLMKKGRLSLDQKQELLSVIFKLPCQLRFLQMKMFLASIQ